jgi:hypothetical protein
MSQALYDMVCAYAELGVHRTGTDNDRATTTWFVDHVARAGAVVDIHSFSFSRYDADWSVEVGGETIRGLPLFYGPAGDFELTDLPFGQLDLCTFDEVAARRHLDQQITDAKADGAKGLLVETRSSCGDVYAMNTHPDWTYNLPVMFVAEETAGPRNRIQLSARLVPGEADIVTARFGHSDKVPPLIITTPLSGWFTCAGERGTGIALSIMLARQLAEHIPVVLIGTSGHEFQYLGCHEHLKTASIDPASMVLHMGSSLATLPSGREGLNAIAHVTGDQFPVMAASLSSMGVDLNRPNDPLSPACWQGESECWAGYGCQMLSLAGVSPTFHTPGDTAAASTTPALLSETGNAILNAMKAMIIT